MSLPHKAIFSNCKNTVEINMICDGRYQETYQILGEKEMLNIYVQMRKLLTEDACE